MSCGCGCGGSGEHQTIRVSAGESDYTWPTRLTELTGEDISSDVAQMSIGTRDAPGSWVPLTSPHRVTYGTILAGDFKRANPQFQVDVPPDTVLYWVEGELLIGAGGITVAPPADVYPWLQLADTPAVLVRRGQIVTVV